VPLGVKGFTSHDGGELVSLEIDIKGAETRFSVSAMKSSSER